MPTIQLYQHQSNLRSQAGPRANPNVFGAAQAQALGAVSAQIGEIGQKLQDTADYRAITEYQLQEQDFAAKQEKWLLDNPNAEKDDILKRYRVERDAFNQSQLRKKHLSKRARERIGLMTQEATTRGDLATTQVARTREIKRAQNLSATVKKQAIDAGDLDAFTLRVDQDIQHGITAPELRDAEINYAKQQIQQIQLNRELAQTLDLPPVQAIEALRGIAQRITDKEEGTDALGYKNSLEYLSKAEAIHRAQEGIIVKNGDAIVKLAGKGKDTTTAIIEALESGRIDQATADLIAPNIEDAKEEFEAARAEAAQRKFESIMTRSQTRFNTLNGRLQNNKLGEGDLERERLAGILSPIHHSQLLAQLRAKAAAAESTPDGEYATIKGKIDKLVTDGFWFIGPRDAAEQEYIEARDLIVKSDLPEPSRIKLVEEFFAAKLLDIGLKEDESGNLKSFNEEESVSDRYTDRSVSEEERGTMLKMAHLVKGNIQKLGSGRALDLFWAHRKQIRNFYEGKPPREGKPTEDLPTLMARIENEIEAAAGDALLQDGFDSMFE